MHFLYLIETKYFPWARLYEQGDFSIGRYLVTYPQIIMVKNSKLIILVFIVKFVLFNLGDNNYRGGPNFAPKSPSRHNVGTSFASYVGLPPDFSGGFLVCLRKTIRAKPGEAKRESILA